MKLYISKWYQEKLWISLVQLELWEHKVPASTIAEVCFSFALLPINTFQVPPVASFDQPRNAHTSYSTVVMNKAF